MIGEYGTCRGCDCALDDTSRPVGDWRFCPVCFTRLMTPTPHRTEHQTNVDAVDDGPSEKEAISAQASELARTFLSGLTTQQAKAQSVCRICEKPSASGQYIDVASLKVCEACYEKMSAPLESKKRLEPEPEPEPKRQPDPVVPVGLRTHRCAGCQRRITPRGAKELDGALYCPECFVAQTAQ